MTPVRYHLGRFPPQRLDLNRLIGLLGSARANIGAYEATIADISNIEMFFMPLSKQEAVSSTAIEGTLATLQDVLLFEAQGDIYNESTPERADRREVLNYITALQNATDSMTSDSARLTQAIVRRAHFDLMQGVRGQDKLPGEYRLMRDDIVVKKGSVTVYVPCPNDRIELAMQAWEGYLHEDNLDPLLQVAITHAEFESIHPFLDGNGRIGRLLIPLSMFEKRLINRPNFYISESIEAYRDEYYERLRAVSRDNDWDGWCEFFLKMTILQARHNRSKALRILALQRETRESFARVTNSGYRDKVVDWIFEYPVFRVPDFARATGVPMQSARELFRRLKDLRVLQELISASGPKPAVLFFPELLGICSESIGRSV